MINLEPLPWSLNAFLPPPLYALETNALYISWVTGALIYFFTIISAASALSLIKYPPIYFSLFDHNRAFLYPPTSPIRLAPRVSEWQEWSAQRLSGS